MESNGYVFISYSRRDTLFVNRLRDDLEKRGIEYWIDRSGIRPGNVNWERTIRDAIREASAMIFVASPHFHGSDVIPGELALAKNLGRPIYPIWAEGAAWVECVPFDMISAQYVDMREGYYTTGLDDLLAALSGGEQQGGLAIVEMLRSAPPVGLQSRNPYKGLLPFTEADTHDYFGRTRLVNTLIEMISTRLPTGIGEDDNRLIAVIGPSGSGKSSVVMAGLIPRLKAGALPGSDHWIYLPPLLPEGDPMMGLMIALKAVMPSRRQDDLRQELNAPDGLGLYRLATQLRRNLDDRVVVFIDQFEEIFTLVDNEELREQFINQLVIAATEPDSPVIVLLTLRADFYDRPMNYPHLGKLIQHNNQSVLPMSLAELLEAIGEPARLPDVQLMFEGELVVEIAFDLLDSREPANKGTSLAGALPLLQFTLDRLYVQRQAYRLTVEAYTDMGGVTGAIGKHAEEVFTALDEAAQKSFARVFYRLVNINEHGTPTRRRGIRADVTMGEGAAERLVTALIDKRLLIADKGDVVEVAHEALLHKWERLDQWIKNTAEDIRSLQKVQAAAQEWVRMGRPDRQLWDYEDLHPVYAAIESLDIEITPVVREFIHPQTERLLEELKTAPEYRQLSIIDRFNEIVNDAAFRQDVAARRDAAAALVAALAFAKGEGVRDGIDTILWKMPDDAARELIAVLGGRENNLRRAAADAVARLGVVVAIPALVNNLRDNTLTYKLPELKALTALADSAAIPALIQSLRAERWEERRQAAEGLGAIGIPDEVAVNALSRLVSDPRQEVRQAALHALGLIGTPQIVRQLIDLLRDPQRDANREPNLTAADYQALILTLGALSENRGRVVLDDVVRGRFKSVLIELSSATEDEIRYAVAEAFGKLKETSVIAQLSFMLRDDNTQVREAVAHTMGVIGHPHGMRPLLNTLSDKSPQVRGAAIRALNTFSGRTDVRQQLRRILSHDVDARVRSAAASVLAEAGDSNSADVLMRRLRDKTVMVQETAIEALGTLNATAAIDPLIDIVKNKRVWQLRHTAAQALAKLNHSRAREALIEIAAKHDIDAAFVAAVALTLFPYQSKRTLETLMEGLDDPRPEVRAAAAGALGNLKHQPAVLLMMARIGDQDGRVRSAAAHALGQIADPSVIVTLEGLTAHPFSGVRGAAQKALDVLATITITMPAESPKTPPEAPPVSSPSPSASNGETDAPKDPRDKTLPLRDMLPKTLIPPRPPVLSPKPPDKPSTPD